MIKQKLCDEYCYLEEEIEEESWSLQRYIVNYEELNKKVCYEHIDHIDELKKLLVKLDNECNKDCFLIF